MLQQKVRIFSHTTQFSQLKFAFLLWQVLARSCSFSADKVLMSCVF